MQAWVFLSVSGERSWQSNDGYHDVLGSHYVYDSGVAYRLQVAPGDLVVVRDENLVLGISRLDNIHKAPATKMRSRCPKCDRTGVEHRKGRGVYVCRHCKGEFAAPAKRREPVTEYVATYGQSWQALDGAIMYEELEPMLGGVAQNAIRPCEIDGLEQLLNRISVEVPAVGAAPDPSPPPQIPGGHREAVGRTRLGQSKFRKELLRTYGLVCAMTGPCPAESLEAAHIRGFAEHGKHDLKDGILLRSDIHKLFDAGRIAVDPEKLVVVTHPALDRYPQYRELCGAQIVPGPDPAALREHFDAATQLW
ncbi:HNH endonuclease [Rhodococcus sp. JS3073]|uniref:HNH endonuclease n=1 Tax=Rhodococcus sp. JS3073 TaxID=3002901 RepID=UPI0022865DED|nr:HNH endonuclease [Rhodococcus sp. JS3073]WAM19817.1 HNH endonuclease [Rhodococcus sp. JS3073]